MTHESIHQLTTRLANENKLVAAICAAPKVLLTNGVLKGKKVSAYPCSLNALDALIKNNNVQLSDATVEIPGNVITSRGSGTAMDFALALIEILLGKEA